MKSKRLFVTGFGLDPIPPDSSIQGKRIGLLGTLSTLALYSLLRFCVILAQILVEVEIYLRAQT